MKILLRTVILGVPVLVLSGAVILSLLGYGAAIAIETTFGVPRELTYTSPLGLLNLSSHAIAGWMEISDDFYKSENFKNLVLTFTGIGVALTAFFLLLRILGHRRERYGRGRRYWSFGRNSVINKIVGCWRWVFKEKLCLAPLAIFAAAPWAICFGMLAVVFLFSIVPLAGYGAAKRYFHSWIVSADYCTPLSSRDERLGSARRKDSAAKSSSEKVKITVCLDIWKDRNLIAGGRHVVSTDKHIVLFNPATGDVRVESLDGVSVHVSGLSVTELIGVIDKNSIDDRGPVNK